MTMQHIGPIAERIVRKAILERPSEAERVAAEWLAHAKGCRRRAHEYKRLALAAEADGNLKTYRHWRTQSDRSWGDAKRALKLARMYSFKKGKTHA